MCVFQLPFRKFFSFLDSKTVYMIDLILFQLVSLICGVSRTLYVFILRRFFASSGVAGINSVGLVLVRKVVTMRWRARCVSILRTFCVIVALLSLVIGGMIVDGLNWWWCFYINFAPAAASLIVLWAAMGNRYLCSFRSENISF